MRSHRVRVPLVAVNSSCSKISLLILLYVSLLSLTHEAGSYAAADNQVKCFCDKFTCPGQLVCTGKWCLIGVRNEGGNGRLDQICGWDDAERPVDCAQSWSKWSEVCACEDDLCNTFAFLRNSIDSRTLLNRDDQDNGGIYVSGMCRKNNNNYSNNLSDTIYMVGSGLADGTVKLPIDNDDRYSDTYSTRGNRRDWLQSNNLIILLVIVPLAVGALVVCLVFLNYHCKMS